MTHPPRPPRFRVDDPFPKNSRPVAFFFVVGLLSFLSGGWLLHRSASPASDVYRKARLLDTVVTLISDFYVDSLNGGRLYDLATDGMLRALADPYTGFLDPDALKDLHEATRGNYIGLGIRIEISDGWITVVAPLADTPAEEAGIQAGDRIVEVEGESTRAWSTDKAVSALRGDSGTTVQLSVARPGMRQLMPFALTRTRIRVTSVRHAQLLEGNIGYVQLETVSDQSAQEVADAVATLADDGARSLILDLRFNPGGLLNEGVAVADLFLDPGEAVVETRGRVEATTLKFEAREAQQWSEMPVVLLVNEFSASAAEVIAGALQDHDRALVLGNTTFGKGLVQSILYVSRTEALRLTTSRWYTPSGRSIHRDRSGSRSFSAIARESAGAIEPDTAFRSDGGRPLAGNGGIRPDVAVPSEAVTEAERRFQRALGPNLQTFQDVLASYAMEVVATGTITDPSVISVTVSMRRELLQRLRARDVRMPVGVWDGAREVVDRQIRRRVLRYAFGREAEMQDQIAADAVVGAAVELLRQSRTQEELFVVSCQLPAASCQP